MTTQAERWPLLYFILASFAFLSVFSPSTSPFFTNPRIGDSGIFQIIGKGWTEGFIPYLDLWDNKGPLLYLLNALGFLITGNKYGVFILQVINLTVALFIIFRLFRQEFNNKLSILLTTLALLWLSNTGLNNNAAEWLLIPICLSFYLLYQWLNNKSDKKLTLYYSIVFGFTIGCGFLLRLSDCLPLVIALLAIAVSMVFKGEWKEVLKHSLICVASFTATLIPFVIYFSVKGALLDMWEASFAHNLEYVMGSTFQSFSLYAIGSFVLSFFNYIGVVLTGLLVILLRLPSRKKAWVWLITSIVTLLFIFHTYAKGTYGLSSLPLFCIVIFQTRDLLHHIPGIFEKICWGGIAVSLLVVFVFQTWQTLEYDNKPDPHYEFYKYLEHRIPTEDHQSFLAYNMWPDIYYYTDFKPTHRFFICVPTYLQGENDSLVDLIRKDYCEKKAKWILVRHSGYPLMIKDILERNYRVEKDYPRGGYTLYRLL